MLKRVLEPEVMDSPGEALEYDSMDHGAVNRQFVDDLLACLASGDKRPHAILDLGTGTAQIPIELCRRDASVHVTAVDASAGMLDLARANVVAAGLFDRVTLGLVDAKRLPYDDGAFDAVISNSIVHHIAQPRGVLAEGVRVTAPGGWLFWRDLLRPESEEQLRRLVDAYAGGATPRQRELFAASLRAALSLDEVRVLVVELGFAGDTVSPSSDRHWTFAARR